MNDTKIEWCDMTWNPVTGCLRGCPYCYARGVAHRFGLPFAPKLGDPGMEGASKYDSPEGMDTMLELKKPYIRDGKVQPFPMAFLPTFHRYRLGEPAGKTKGKTIFVCSMADLFGPWVPTKWIVDVLDDCLSAPQHRYLFLTKNPKRYLELNEAALLPLQDNFWYGSTVTSPDDPMMVSGAFNTFISIEPLLAPMGRLGMKALSGIDWFIVGAETGNRKGKVVPEKAWVQEIVDYCRASGKPVFMKDSLIPIVGKDSMVREFPWEVS